LNLKVLSFIIPAYNSEKYLDKCISSMLVPEVLDQLEIIVVNDGSKDATVTVAQEYCHRYPNTVRLISQENKGHGGALNTGCAAAQGKYLKVIDADDWVQSEHLPSFVKALESCESDVVLTHYRTVNISTGELRNWMLRPERFDTLHTFESIISNWWQFESGLTFHGITYRTGFYHQQGHQLAEHVFYEDHEFATYPCCHAAGITALDLSVYDYRIGDVNQSVSDANQLKRISHVETVLRKMTDAYSNLAEGAGKSYAAIKLKGLLMSYLTTALLVNPDKKEGRLQAQRQMTLCRDRAPAVYEMTKKKHQIFVFMNRLHIGKQRFEKWIDSGVYRRLLHK
jgi:hypothetical protein